MHITLTYNEACWAARIGTERRLASLHLPDRHGATKSWDTDIEAAAGELAAAKALGITWQAPVNTFHQGADAGPYQVRHTPLPHGRLIIRHTDRPTDVFILVTGTMPRYRVHGWILGSDARQDRWAKAPAGRAPAWFVPQEALNGMETIKAPQQTIMTQG